jgi:hypothetical protein
MVPAVYYAHMVCLGWNRTQQPCYLQMKKMEEMEEMEFVTTHLPNKLFLKMDGTQACYIKMKQMEKKMKKKKEKS